MKRLLLIFMLILQGCAIFSPLPPTIDNLKGSWESAGLVYMHLDIEDENNAYLVAIGEEGEYSLYRVETFEFFKKKFTVKLINQFEQEESETLTGTISHNRLSLSNGQESSDGYIWFTKSTDINAYRALTMEVLEDVKLGVNETDEENSSVTPHPPVEQTLQ